MKPGYKQTEVGVIPDDWDVCQVRQKGEVVTGKALAVKAPGQQRPYLRTKNVFDGRIDLDDVLTMPMTDEQFAHFRLRHGDVLLNEGQSLELVGRCAIYQGEYPEACAIQNQLLRFRARGDVSAVFASYVFRYCQQTGAFARIALQTTSIAHLGGSRFGRLCLAWPKTEPEQRAIAEALSDADALIDSLERLVAKKRDVKQGAMQELLTGRRRLPGFTGEWEEKRLDSLFDFGKGVSAPRDKLSSTGHCYLHYGDIHTSTKTHVNVAAEQHELPRLNIPLQRVSPASLLEDGDVVFVDASEDDAGTSRHLVIFNPGRIPFISGLHTIVAKSKTDELDRSYRCYCFQTAEVQRQFIHYAVGTKVSGISKGNLGKISMLIPPRKEQAAIAAVLYDIDTETAALEAKLAKARTIKQGMMQELLTGKIRLVSPASGETPMPARETLPQGAPQPHNWQINEAVVIAVLAKHFGSEQWPLGRKRYTKLSYLLHRHVEQRADGYLKKAAGPYNPAMKYKGPEGIALKNRYIRRHVRDQFEGFVADNRVAQAEEYFSRWYGNDVLSWLEQFRKKRNDELELIATVDMAMEELRRSELPAELATVKQIIQNTPEWAAKLQREIFSDANITLAINTCIKLFA